MIGTVAILVVLLVTGLTSVHLNLGLLATMAISSLFAVIALLVMNFIEKLKKEKRESKTGLDRCVYSSESSKLADSMSGNFDRLVKTIALERSKSAGESEVSPEGMKIAFNIAIQEFQNHRDEHACSENTIIDCLKEMTKKHAS